MQRYLDNPDGERFEQAASSIPIPEVNSGKEKTQASNPKKRQASGKEDQEGKREGGKKELDKSSKRIDTKTGRSPAVVPAEPSANDVKAEGKGKKPKLVGKPMEMQSTPKAKRLVVQIEVENGFTLPDFFKTATTVQKSAVLTIAGEVGSSIVTKLTEKSASEQTIQHLCDTHLKLNSLMGEKYEHLEKEHRATSQELSDLRQEYEKISAASVATTEEESVMELECAGHASEVDAGSKGGDEPHGGKLKPSQDEPFMQQHFKEMFKMCADHAKLVETLSHSMDAIRAKELQFYELCKSHDTVTAGHTWEKLPFEDGLKSMRSGIPWNNISKKQKEMIAQHLGKRTADSAVGANSHDGKIPKAQKHF